MYGLGEAGAGPRAHMAGDTVCVTVSASWLPDGCRQGLCILVCKLLCGKNGQDGKSDHGLGCGSFSTAESSTEDKLSLSPSTRAVFNTF